MTVFSKMIDTGITYGIVYKIIDRLTNDLLYVGSSFNFPIRKSKHKSDYNNINSKEYNKKLYVYIRTLDNGFNSVKFKIIEFVDTTDKKNLEKVERHYIDILNPFCNIVKPQRTLKEYYNDNKQIKYQYNKQYYTVNKEQVNKQSKEYYIVNKDIIIEQQKQYYIDNIDKIKHRQRQNHNCEICGSCYTKSNKARHIKSPKHQQAINSNIIITTTESTPTLSDSTE